MKPPTSRSEHYVDVVRKLTPELEVLADQIEAENHIPVRVREVMLENDLVTLTLPEDWGGRGLSVAEYAPVLEEVAKISGALRMIVHGQNGMWRLVEHWGTPAQKQHWLPKFAEGRTITFGLTEPGNGTGRDISTTAVLDGDEWVINGRKQWISWAGTAEMIHLIAATGRDDRGGAIATCFLLPKGTPGMTCTPMPDTMGCRGVHHDYVDFQDCRLPKDSVLGGVGQGLELGLRGFLDVSRLGIAISAVGLATRTLELSLEFAVQRVTFGKPIASRQAVKLAIAEMASELYAVDNAIMAAAYKFDRGESIEAEAAMCKLLAIEMVGRVTDRAMRLHGGLGYCEVFKIERHYRDARALWFEEGTAEIQKIVVANDMLKNGIGW
jgi:alkylation response protein AidB-like acyl-CoA dehydrogenase